MSRNVLEEQCVRHFNSCRRGKIENFGDAGFGLEWGQLVVFLWKALTPEKFVIHILPRVNDRGQESGSYPCRGGHR